MTAGDSSQHQIRWLPCKNVSDSIAPPYAMMTIREGEASKLPVDDAAESRRYGHELKNDRVVWRVGPNTFQAYERQFPGEIVANGPLPIQPGGYGVCTQDWPARMLVLESSEGDLSLSGGTPSAAESINNDISKLAIGDDVGPGWNWGLTTAGDAFRLVSFDLAETRRIEDKLSATGGAGNTYRVCWVAPGHQFTPDFRAPHGFGFPNDDPFEPRWFPGDPLLMARDLQSNAGRGRHARGITTKKGGIGFDPDAADRMVIAEGGMHLIHFGSSGLWGDTEEDGIDLVMQLAINGELQFPHFASRRSHVVLADAYHAEASVTRECVTHTCFIALFADDVVQVFNTSSVPLLAFPWFFVVRLGPLPAGVGQS